MKKIILALGTIGVLCLNSYSFAAGTANTTNLQSTANLTSSCQIQANSINIGEIGTNANNSSGTSALSVVCTKNTSFNITIGLGQNGDTTNNIRYLVGTSNHDKIAYSICRDTCSTGKIWYNTADTTVSDVGIGTLQQYYMVGQVNNGYYTPDTYTDTTTATITY